MTNNKVLEFCYQNYDKVAFKALQLKPNIKV